MAFEVVCEPGTKAKNTILYREKERGEGGGGHEFDLICLALGF